MTARLPPDRCTGCGYVVDAATGVREDARGVDERFKPRPGDITVCIRCGHVMAYDANRRLRELNAIEMHAIAGDKRLLAVQRARAEVERRRRDKLT